MAVETSKILVDTSENTDIIDLTHYVKGGLMRSPLGNGTVTLFIPGSTAALTTIEYEKGVINDLKKAIDRVAPKDMYYEHNEAWGDGNGYSHVRAALLGPSLNIPFVDGKLTIGTWQQVVLVDFDNRPRKRQIIMQISGE